MADMTWLAQEAKNIHLIFTQFFYAMILCFLLLSVLVEYFNWPLGGTPSFGPLVGRAFVACVLLNTYPEVTNLLADVADGISRQLGELNAFKLVLARMGDKLGELTWSWVSVKDSVMLLISFITYFILYFSVHVADSFMLYTWTLLYVFSPLLIALFVLPSTSGATKALYRSLIEVSCWKIVWSVLATLLWSAVLSDINKPGTDVSFVAAICFNLILAGSLLMTPMVVHSLAGSGLASMARTVGAIAVGSTVIGPATVAKAATDYARKGYQGTRKFTEATRERYFSKAQKNPSSPTPSKGKK